MEKNHNTSWSRSKHLTIALLTLTLLTSGISLLLALLPPTWVFSTLGSRICPGARFQFEPSKGDLTPSLNTDRNTDRPLVALTLDDGPDPNPDLSTNATAQVLDLLAQHQVQATFFVIGENLKTPIGQTLAQRMVAEGHELGNHMMVDQKSVELAPAAFEQQLQQADQILKTFATPNWFRPGGAGAIKLREKSSKLPVINWPWARSGPSTPTSPPPPLPVGISSTMFSPAPLSSYTTQGQAPEENAPWPHWNGYCQN
jgi:hypothetical protein